MLFTLAKATKISAVCICFLITAVSVMARQKSSDSDILATVSGQKEKPIFVIFKDEKTLDHHLPLAAIEQTESSGSIIKRSIEENNVTEALSERATQRPEIEINPQIVRMIDKTASLQRFIASIEPSKRSDSMNFDCNHLSELQKSAICSAFDMNEAHLKRGSVRLDFRSWAWFTPTRGRNAGLPVVQMNEGNPAVKVVAPQVLTAVQKALALKDWCAVLRSTGDTAYVDARYEDQILFVRLPRPDYRLTSESLSWGMEQSSGLRWRTVGDIRFLTMNDEKELPKKLEGLQKSIMSLMKQGDSKTFSNFEEMADWNSRSDKYSSLVDLFKNRISRSPEIGGAYARQGTDFSKGRFSLSLDVQIKTDGFGTTMPIRER